MKRILGSALCGFMLSFAVGSASANNLSASTQQIRVTWNSLELSNTINETVVRCPVILEGSLNSSTMIKRLESVIGDILRANVADGECRGGHATINRETLPWSIRYGGFVGALPRITGIKISLIRAAFEISDEGGRVCSVVTTTATPAKGIIELNAATGENTGIRADGSARIPLREGRGGFGCIFGNGSFTGMSEPIVQPDPAISFRLI